MNAVDILNRCRDATGVIKRLDERLARLRECAMSTTSRLNQTGRGSGGVSDKIGAFAADIDECGRALDARKRAYDAELLAACKIMDMLPESECGVLYRYYVQGQTINGIARALNYSASYVKQKKRDGLASAEAIPEGVVLGLLPDWYRRAYGEEE